MSYEQWAYYPDDDTWKQVNYSEAPCLLESVETPLGPILIAANDQFIHQVSFVYNHNNSCNLDMTYSKQKKTGSNLPSLQARTQLEEYFLGKRIRFSLPLYIHGTPFQCQVWRTLASIPYGTTQSYKELALLSCFPRAVRAVGTAMRNNPIGIILPCHRIIGNNGKLVGYYGGLQYKIWLLEHESKHRTASL